MGHGVGQAVDPHFDPHLKVHFYNEKHPKSEDFRCFLELLTRTIFCVFATKKASKTEVFDAFCRVLTEKMRSGKFQASIASYIESYNTQMPHRTLKNLTPCQVEENSIEKAE